MKIKITSCSESFLWYTEQIGSVFEVLGITNENFVVTNPPSKSIWWIRKCDCIELPELVTLTPDSLCKIANRLAQPIPVDLADQLIELSKPKFPTWKELVPDSGSIRQIKNSVKMATFQKLLMAADWVNEGWRPDWSNGNERKWSMNYCLNTGSFSVQHAYAHADCYVCFKSEEAALKVIELFRANGDEQDLINLLTS